MYACSFKIQRIFNVYQHVLLNTKQFFVKILFVYRTIILSYFCEQLEYSVGKKQQIPGSYSSMTPGLPQDLPPGSPCPVCMKEFFNGLLMSQLPNLRCVSTIFLGNGPT